MVYTNKCQIYQVFQSFFDVRTLRMLQIYAESDNSRPSLSGNLRSMLKADSNLVLSVLSVSLYSVQVLSYVQCKIYFFTSSYLVTSVNLCSILSLTL